MSTGTETVKAKKAKTTRVAKKDATGTVDLKVYNAQGKEVGTRSVPAAIFGCEINKSLLHEVVRWQLAKKRAGTHATQTRAEMTGGGAKPWKQKGTGRARAGSNTSPLWVGGGIAHGPKPRKYNFELNSQERHQAICSAFSARVSDGTVMVLEDFGLKDIKTKTAANVLKSLGVTGRSKAVVVLAGEDTSAQKSLRNVDRVVTLTPAGLNVYDLINAKYIILTKQGLDGVEARLTR